MARIRTIKPDFFLHEDLAELSPLHRLLFIGLWCLADREGRMEDRPKRIKIEILPWDDCDMDRMLSDLQRSGFISRYLADGLGVIEVTNFKRHQRFTGKEAETSSRFPSPTTGTPRGIIGETPEQHPGAQEGKGREGKEEGGREGEGKEHSCPKTDVSGRVRSEEYRSEFEDAWKVYPRKVDKQEAFKAYQARRRDRAVTASAEQLMASAQNYADHIHDTGAEERYIKHGATFWGPNRPYLEWLEPRKSTPKAGTMAAQMDVAASWLQKYGGDE